MCCGDGWLQVWQDGHKRSRGDPNFLTLWKPIAPAGYVSMGMLASVGGREPPSYNLVRGAAAAWCARHMRPSVMLLSVPVTCVHYCERHVLCAVAHTICSSCHLGVALLLFLYVLQVRCVRADMASRVDLQASSPALIFYPYKTRPALGGWVADERASSFVVVSHDGSPQLLEAFRLKELEEGDQKHQHQQQSADKATQGKPARGFAIHCI
jgi:hypothetical protein